MRVGLTGDFFRRKAMRKISMLYLLLAGIFLLAGCSDETASIQKEEETDYARVTLFSDVEFWHPPA